MQPSRQRAAPQKHDTREAIRQSPCPHICPPGYLPSDTNPSQKTITVDICALVTVSIRSYGVTGVK